MVSKKWMRVTTYWVKSSIRMRNSSIKRTNNIHHRTVLGLFFKNLGGLGVLKDGEGESTNARAKVTVLGMPLIPAILPPLSACSHLEI